MPTKKQRQERLNRPATAKEVSRLIRLARCKWKAHENQACRRERDRALALYEALDPSQREEVPQALRVWLRYRSEKYFGRDRKGRGANSKR